MAARWTPPDRPLFRTADARPRIAPLYDPAAPRAARQAGRAAVLEFLARWHYLHHTADAKHPAMTWAFGLWLDTTLSGVLILNPPAAGVCQWLYGSDTAWRRQTIAVTRLACTDAAPFNTESYFVSRVLRLLPQHDDRWATAVSFADRSVIDPFGRAHTGGIYAAANAWWAGISTPKSWRGFRDPETGARLSRKCGGRTRSRAECPPGWVLDPAQPLNRFLWFCGPSEAAARDALQPHVKVVARPDRQPLWIRPRLLTPRMARAYPGMREGIALSFAFEPSA